MKKHLLIFLLAFIGLTAYSQTVPTLPVGAKPYGNQLYIVPSTGLIYSGNAGFQYRVLGTKTYVDSLIALKQNALGYTPENLTNKTTSLSSPNDTKYPTSQAVATGLALKENTITAATMADYYRGDKTFATLNKAAVGLGNVDNTSDANKPVSTATTTALGLKANITNPTFETFVRVNGNMRINSIRLGAGDTTLYNVYLGNNAFVSNTTGNANVAVGLNGLMSNTTGHDNTAIGGNAGRFNTIGYANTFLGASSGYNNTTGIANSFLGYQAGFRNTTQTGGLFVGSDAGYRNFADNNIFMGFHSGFQASNPDNITGTLNLFIGGETAGFLNTGYNNVGIGYNSTYSMTSGNNNVAIGYNTGFSFTTANKNTIVGVESAPSIVTGTNNSTLGYRSLFSATTNAYYNTAIGDLSLFGNTTGFLNTGVGGRTGMSITTGSSNTFVGIDAGNNASQKVDAINSTAIGSLAYTDKNSQVVLGAGTVVETVINGTLVRRSGDVFTYLSTSVTVPTPTGTGTKGETRYINPYFYRCVATNTWTRQLVDITW